MRSSQQPSEELKRILAQPAKDALAQRLGVFAWLVTLVVLLLVGAMRRPEFRVTLPDGWSFSGLPFFHATINVTTAILLVFSVIVIKQGKVLLHQRLMMLAMLLSIVFLASYVTYHFTHAETLFGDIDHDRIVDETERAKLGWKRPVYLGLLLSHIAMAAVSLPAILFTFIAAWTNRFATHRRLATWVFPMWLYVTVTGPICYWMLRPYYLAN